MKYILYLGLFENINGRITCFKLLKRLDTSMTSNAHMRELITSAKENHDRVMTESCKNRLEENRLEQIREEERRGESRSKQPQRFLKPTIHEIKDYCKERKNNIDAEYFFNYYESKGWMIGKTPMKKWQAAIYTWEKHEKEFNADKPKPSKIRVIEDLPIPPPCPVCGAAMKETAIGLAGCRPCKVVLKYLNNKWQVSDE